QPARDELQDQGAGDRVPARPPRGAAGAAAAVSVRQRVIVTSNPVPRTFMVREASRNGSPHGGSESSQALHIRDRWAPIVAAEHHQLLRFERSFSMNRQHFLVRAEL